MPGIHKRRRRPVRPVKKGESELDKLRTVVADMMIKRGAIDFTGGQKLKRHEEHPDEPLSLVYFNLRGKSHPGKPGPLLEPDLDLFAHCLLRLVWENNIVFSAITGLPRSGAAIIAALERIMPTPRGFRIVPLAKREKGGQRRIIRARGQRFRKGEAVLLVDDVLSYGTSVREARRIVEGDGASVVAIAEMIDRLQGGHEELRQAGYKAYSVFTAENLLVHCLLRGEIDYAKYRECMAYFKFEREKSARRK